MSHQRFSDAITLTDDLSSELPQDLHGTQITMKALAHMQRVNFDPFVCMIDIARSSKNKAAVRLNAAAELASYIRPKFRTAEINITTRSVVEQMQDALNALKAYEQTFTAIAVSDDDKRAALITTDMTREQDDV